MEDRESRSWTAPSSSCSHETVQWLLIAAIGAGVGYLGGLFGKGGSAIATPLLAAIGIPPLVAVASPLPATIPGTLVAYNRYRRFGITDGRVVRWSIAIGVPATILGAYATRWIDGGALDQGHRPPDRAHRLEGAAAPGRP